MYPKFKLWNGKQLEVISMDFQPEPLRDRSCGDCGSTTYFAVHLRTSERRYYLAMCEGCKKLVEMM